MPTLAIEFSRDDLLRVRPGPADPMWEIVLSVHVLQQTEGLDSRLRRWRTGAMASLRTRMSRVELSDLFSVCPAVGNFPDFLTPGGAGDLEAHLERIRRTPADRVRAEVSAIATEPLPGATLPALLAAEPPAGLARLTRVLRRYHRAGRRTRDRRAADLAAFARDRATQEVDGGIEAILSAFEPTVARWESPVLSVPYCEDRTLRLNGRGLTLVPSWFCFRHAVTLTDDTHPPVLVHPIRPVGPEARCASPDPAEAIAALIGGTRARILLHCEGRSTGDIADELGLAASTVSEHVGVLRDSGLVVTSRAKTRTRHERTATGDQLIGQ